VNAKTGRASTALGLVGLALVLAGVMQYNVRYCVAGAAFLIVAVLLHIVHVLR
jgi:hypothetical protein